LGAALARCKKSPWQVQKKYFSANDALAIGGGMIVQQSFAQCR
jgi:hypothetical protein